MNLKESIRRVLRENSTHTWLSAQYDKVFDNLNLVVKIDNDGSIYGKWYDKEKNVIFSRNHWGVFWVNDCETYKTLRFYSKFLSLSFNKFENTLIEYVNDRYGDKFFGRPIKAVNDEYFCLENDDQDGVNESNSKKGIGKKLKGSGVRILREEVNVKPYILRRYGFEELESILNQKLNNQSNNFKHYKNKSLDFFMNSVINTIVETILEHLTDGWTEDSPVSEENLYEFIKNLFEDKIEERWEKIKP